jgi:hypothetical protein
VTGFLLGDILSPVVVRLAGGGVSVNATAGKPDCYRVSDRHKIERPSKMRINLK